MSITGTRQHPFAKDFVNSIQEESEKELKAAQKVLDTSRAVFLSGLPLI